MLTAKEAKALAVERISVSPEMRNLLRVVEEEATIYGRTSCHYYTGGSGVRFTDEHLEYIRSLGYTIEWNSPCLWYEISWE
jgi:hypothetical protein